ncbi:hypothetical protein LX15_001386 [Streptoalloteichus tenebrarius]|uniref:Uncharacterized protein n=1 Tax=Streptoalloteichus tenebrarius (strain ATCC 17920 / DSM 40477 / JCM 4838 / CBS 697.72 / NBRC 16177 / NCIMB 11028 / NRRL B-12390 / A12253. 1 / ISP 5477) TaxID=1933 RepID=A0ABT1HQB3_STRSD|nr:hypothetical protein [Streptoalloteichus tenebrarius]MCP2257700.1 hypothetical protein [Streptoalloteichus tenebrarius]BFE99947.1 hypothetical protein GCM10020241_16230 [Streptoalloteichus tenebrarius]
MGRHDSSRRGRGSSGDGGAGRAGHWLEPVIGTMAIVALSATLVAAFEDDAPLVQLGDIRPPSAPAAPPTSTPLSPSSGLPLPPGAAGGVARP